MNYFIQPKLLTTLTPSKFFIIWKSENMLYEILFVKDDLKDFLEIIHKIKNSKHAEGITRKNN